MSNTVPKTSSASTTNNLGCIRTFCRAIATPVAQNGTTVAGVGTGALGIGLAGDLFVKAYQWFKGEAPKALSYVQTGVILLAGVLLQVGKLSGQQYLEKPEAVKAADVKSDGKEDVTDGSDGSGSLLDVSTGKINERVSRANVVQDIPIVEQGINIDTGIDDRGNRAILKFPNLQNGNDSLGSKVV